MIKVGDRVTMIRAQDEGNPAYDGLVHHRLRLEHGTRLEVMFDNGIIRCVDDCNVRLLGTNAVPHAVQAEVRCIRS